MRKNSDHKKLYHLELLRVKASRNLTDGQGNIWKKEKLTTLELHCANSEDKYKKRFIPVVMMKQ